MTGLDAVLEAWDAAWAADDPAPLVARALAPDGELVDPAAGRFSGHDAVVERLRGFQRRFPGARVTITTAVDEHHGFARYGWTITGPDGQTVLDGLDVVERANDGRLRRVVMFFGPLT